MTSVGAGSLQSPNLCVCILPLKLSTLFKKERILDPVYECLLPANWKRISIGRELEGNGTVVTTKLQSNDRRLRPWPWA